MPIYEMAETLVRNFNLCKDSSDAYVQFFLDTIFDFSKKHSSDIMGFLDYYETKKEVLSIAMPNNLNAVSVMTIHKSKGLEFPVVIYPFADLDIYKELEPKEWFPLAKENYLGFENALINFSKDFENYGTAGEEIYKTHQSELELDGINLLYVTMTRAVERLYVISKKDINKKGVVNENTYAGLFIKYLQNKGLWENEKESYNFGKLSKHNTKGAIEDINLQYDFISSSKESHNLKIITSSSLLWDTQQEKAINYGNLIHLVMSRIKTSYDIDFAIASVLSEGHISNSEIENLKDIIINITSHKELLDYYSDKYTIYNEKDIIANNGVFLRPDRLVISENKVVIIDYKTGAEDQKHALQLNSYAKVLNDMNFEVEKKLLIYTNEPITILEVK